VRPTRRKKRRPKAGKERNSGHDISSDNNLVEMNSAESKDNHCVIVLFHCGLPGLKGGIVSGYYAITLRETSHTREAIASKCTNSPRPVRTPITRNPCLCPFRERQVCPSRAALLSDCRRLAGRTQGQHTWMQCESAHVMTGLVDDDDDGCRSDVTNLRDEVVELLLGVVVLLGHVLVLLLPLVGGLLKCLHLALVVAGLDVGLAEPVR
jgi:hypothetical protein